MMLTFTPPPLEEDITAHIKFVEFLKQKKLEDVDNSSDYDFAIFLAEGTVSMLEAEQPKKQLLAT